MLSGRFTNDKSLFISFLLMVKFGFGAVIPYPINPSSSTLLKKLYKLKNSSCDMGSYLCV